MATIGIFHSTIRADEKLIIASAKKKGIKLKLIDIRNEIFDIKQYKPNFDLALIRSVSTTKGMYAAYFLESLGVPVVNSFEVGKICEDKFLTSLVLFKSGVPTPKFALAFSFEEAKKAVNQLGGFPIVVKPVLGSWGRLLAKINDIDSLEAVIEHKNVLGSPQQKIFYLQEYIPKPGRDIRSFVIGGRVICAIYRYSSHWITNTAQGGKAVNCPLTKDIKEISELASKAIGGGILALDIFETKDGLKVNEVNHTMEFKNSQKPTKKDIASSILDYCLEVIKKHD